MKKLLTALAFATAAICTTAFAQTYKPDFATKVVLAGVGTDIANTVTLLSPAQAGPISLTLPVGNPAAAGYVLSASALGVMSWVNPAVVANAWNLGGNAAPASNILGNNAVGGALDIHSNNATTLYLTGTNQVGVGLNNPSGLVANTSANPLFNALGTNSRSLNWEASAGGWTGIFNNTGALAGANGVAIGVSSNLAGTSLLLLQAPGNIILNVTADGKVITSAGSTVTVSNLAAAGVVHNAAGGLLQTSLIVAGDVTTNTLTYNKIQQAGASTILGNPTGALANVSEITLDPTLKFTGTTLAIDLTHANNWTGAQTITGGSKFIYNDGFAAANRVLQSQDATGTAKWVDLSTFGVTTATGTAPITINGDNLAHSGAITVALTQGSLTTSTGAITIAGTGKTVGSNISVDLATGSLSAPSSSLTIGGTGLTVGSGITADINVGHANSWTAKQSIAGASNFQYTGNGEAAGKVLTSDVSGNASWATPGGTLTLSPSTVNAFAGNTNNYAINANNTVYYLQNTTGGSINLTGLANGTADRLIVLVNNSAAAADAIVLTSRDASSTNVNQFHLAADSPITLGVDGTVTLIYDSNATNSTNGVTNGAWRVISAN